MATGQKQRPAGVTIIGILALIVGIISIFGGLAVVAVGSIIVGFPSEFELPPGEYDVLGFLDVTPELLGIIFLALGVFLFGQGIAFIFASYGTLKGKGWAWPFNVVLAVISIISNASSMVFLGIEDPPGHIISGSVGIAINAVILYYLYRPHVKIFFGHGISPSAASP